VGSVAQSLLRSQQTGLIAIILLLACVMTLFAGTHTGLDGVVRNNFLNSHTLVQVATDASFFAIMAVGATFVIVSGGIDLSVGAVYALAGVTMALVLRAVDAGGTMAPVAVVLLGVAICLGVGVLAGLLNGIMVVTLDVHPFIITLGTMWVLRGIAFVSSHAESILVPAPLMTFAKASLGLRGTLSPVPMLAMLVVTVLGELYLTRTVMGRHIVAVGGNPEASRFSGLRLGRVRMGVYVLAGLTAGIATFLGASFYGSASCADANGYELYVIASTVVGGASLNGGKGSAVSATLGAILIVMIRQAIRTFHLDQNYEWIIIGLAIIIAVVLDRHGTRLLTRRLAIR
jgi:ribose transport system permease protein